MIRVSTRQKKKFQNFQKWLRGSCYLVGEWLWMRHSNVIGTKWIPTKKQISHVKCEKDMEAPDFFSSSKSRLKSDSEHMIDLLHSLFPTK